MEYGDGASVDLKVNKLTSVKTQLPYDYYTLPFCRPKVIMESAENLGEILEGDRIENSPYEINMREDVTCKILCKQTLTPAMRTQFESMIKDEYLVNWILDNLPAATKYVRKEKGEVTYMNGFPVGVQKSGKFYLHNHVRIDLKYHRSERYEGYRIVGFEVEPFSMSQAVKELQGQQVASCHEGAAFPVFDLSMHDELMFTYDVVWVESEIRWVSRFDNYLKMTGGQIHWFSILNSLMIMLFLSGMIAMIILRTIHRDISKYNELASAEEAAEETGWKLVHGDVFRKPKHSKLLAVSVGSGVQIICMCVVTLILALLGILSPAHRGALLQSMMLLFTFMGIFAGYVSSRIYKVWNGVDWKQTTLLTAFLYPGIFFWYLFHTQSVHLGPEVFRCCTVYNHVCDAVPLVWHFSATRLLGRLLWIQKGQHRAASQDQPDPTTDPRTVLVHEAYLHDTSGRCASVWGSLYGALLHHVIHLATSVLLPVWVLGSRAGDSSHHVC